MKPSKEELDYFIKNIKASYKQIKTWEEGDHWGNETQSDDFIFKWLIVRRTTMQKLRGVQGGEEDE